MKRYILLASLLVTMPAMAEVAVPNTFVAGDTASADEVNANFKILEDAINNRPRVVANDAATELGTLLTPEGLGIAVATDTGYMVRGLQTRTGELKEVALLYPEQDCGGAPFIATTDMGNGSVYEHRGALYYIDYAATPREFAPTAYSVGRLDGTCDNSGVLPLPGYVYFDAVANEPSVTGVVNNPTSMAPFTVQ